MATPKPPPLNLAFVERLPELTKKGDRHRTKTHRHWWAPCTECEEGTYVATKDLGRPCRMTAGCQGRHRKPQPQEEK